MRTKPKDDYLRLLFAAEQLCKWNGPTAVSKGLTENGYEASEQLLSNWKTRGISSDGKLRASKIIGIRPAWLATGEGEMRDNTAPLYAKEPNCQLYNLDDKTINEAIALIRSVDFATQQQMLGQIKMLANEYRLKIDNPAKASGM